MAPTLTRRQQEILRGASEAVDLARARAAAEAGDENEWLEYATAAELTLIRDALAIQEEHRTKGAEHG